jgi:hypothetical protein
MLSIDELAEYLGKPVRTIYDWRLATLGARAAGGARRAFTALPRLRRAGLARRTARAGAGGVPRPRLRVWGRIGVIGHG